MNKRLLIVLFLIAGANLASFAQTVYFNGLGRALVTTDKLDGNILNANGSGRPRDLVNPTRGTGGYTIFDLGVNAQPNETLRASAILRVRNEFGGFYGDGSLLQFRQLRLDGVISKIVKYEIGDIDLGLTPYTVYNFDEMYHDYEADIFAIRRSIVHYENFNFGNKWRVQGAQAAANIKFAKALDKIEIRAFASRTRRTNYLNLPDRLLYGGRVNIVQSKYAQVGGNLTTFADVVNTSPSDIENYKNQVVTGDYKVGYNNDKIDVSLYGEFGASNYKYDTTVSVKRNGSFYDLGISGTYKPLNLKVFASYRNVSIDFTSPAAQTRRIYDYGVTPSMFGSVLGGTGTEAVRPLSLLDRYSDENIRNLTIMSGLMAYLPQYNNITPYGIATPNRKGITAGVSAGGNDKILKADVIVDMLSEATPIGNNEGRDFFGVKGGFVFNLNKVLKFEKGIAINAGIRNEHTQQDGANKIDLKSNLIDAGLTVEVYKGLDLLGGYKMLTAKGNEIITSTDPLNPFPYTNLATSLYSYSDLDIKESVWAVGGRYRFGKNSYFTVQGHFADFVNKKNNFNNYKINQLFFNYTMLF